VGGRSAVPLSNGIVDACTLVVIDGLIRDDVRTCSSYNMYEF